jgi:hypothetical protein
MLPSTATDGSSDLVETEALPAHSDKVGGNGHDGRREATVPAR